MSYYITAHRHGSKINMPIEEKHKYITDSVIRLTDGSNYIGSSEPINSTIQFANNISIRKFDLTTVIDANAKSATTNPIVPSLNLNASDIKLFYRPQNLKITQGTGSQERIGDKVFLKSVKIILNMSLINSAMIGLNGNDEVQNTIVTSYPVSYAGISQQTNVGVINSSVDTNVVQTYNNSRLNVKQFYKFRVMIVRFNDFDFALANAETRMKTYVQNWFNKIWVPQFIIPEPASGSPYEEILGISNQSKMLRESTEYNGKYKIMYDQVIELNEKDSAKHIEINLDPKMNLTFDDNNKPTTEDFNNVVGFIIPPTLYKYDIDPITMWETQFLASDSASVAEFTTNIKFTYYDI